MKVETIKIVSKEAKGGFVVINKSDLTNKHEVYGAKPKPKLEVVTPKKETLEEKIPKIIKQSTKK